MTLSNIANIDNRLNYIYDIENIYISNNYKVKRPK